VIHEESSAPRTPPSTEEAPCVCYDGLVFIGCLIEDLESGEEVEIETAYLVGALQSHASPHWLLICFAPHELHTYGLADPVI